MRGLALIGLCVLAGVLRAGWSHLPPPDLYQKLSLAQRADLDKALALYGRGGEGKTRDQQLLHRSAANEWERFRTLHGADAPQDFVGYSLLMQAMSQSAAMEKHTAIRTYTEVLDLFPDRVWVAAPALYFRGRTYLDMGDEAKGMGDMREMTEDPEYSKNPLAADAFNRVAENHWRNKRTREAAELWGEVVERFKGSAREEAREASLRLLDWRMIQGDLAGAVEELAGMETRGEERDRRLNASRRVFETVQNETYGKWRDWYFVPVLGEKRAGKAQSDLIGKAREWFAGMEGEFTAAGRGWEFEMLRFDELARFDKGRLEGFVPSVIRRLREKEKEETRAGKARQLMGKLAGVGRVDEALSLLDLLPEARERLWAEFGLQAGRKAWERALMTLDQIEGLEDAEELGRARRERARIYHRETGRYEEAIQLYQEINDPPGTLWEIVDCYRRWGKKEEAQNTLTEIASIFPGEAARAVFAKAEMYRGDGEKERAVGLYRNLLGHPEWRKTREASQAHDRLEDMGIETGGAVIHEVN